MEAHTRISLIVLDDVPHLQNTTFNHDLHPVYRDARNLIDGFLECRRRGIRVEGQIMNLSCMFYVYVERGHR